LKGPTWFFSWKLKTKQQWWKEYVENYNSSIYFLENPTGIAGGLAILWNEEVALKVKDSSKQFINVECTDLNSRHVMQITFFYASTNFGERLTLWQKV